MQHECATVCPLTILLLSRRVFVMLVTHRSNLYYVPVLQSGIPTARYSSSTSICTLTFRCITTTYTHVTGVYCTFHVLRTLFSPEWPISCGALQDRLCTCKLFASDTLPSPKQLYTVSHTQLHTKAIGNQVLQYDESNAQAVVKHLHTCLLAEHRYI